MLFTLRGGADGLVAPDVGCVLLRQDSACAASRCVRFNADRRALRLRALPLPRSFPGCLPEATPTPPAVSAVRQAAAELGLPKEVRPARNGRGGGALRPKPSVTSRAARAISARAAA